MQLLALLFLQLTSSKFPKILMVCALSVQACLELIYFHESMVPFPSFGYLMHLFFKAKTFQRISTAYCRYLSRVK